MGANDLYVGPARAKAGSGYRLRPVMGLPEWEEHFQSVGQPHLMQSWAYGQAKQAAARWHVRRLVFERGETPVAICQVLEKRVAGLRVAARINRGPLFLDPAPAYEEKENVYRLLRREWSRLLGGPLLIAPALESGEENRDLLLRLGFKTTKKNAWCSAWLDLRQEEEALRAALAPTWRNRLKSSLRSGLGLEISHAPEAVEWMLSMHAQNMREKKFEGPNTALLAALYQARPSDFVVLKAMLEQQAVGGMIVARFGATAEYYIGWFGAAGRKANVGNFLYWNAVLEMQKRGHRWFDLGGYYSSDKFGHFKQAMGGREYRLIGEWWTY